MKSFSSESVNPYRDVHRPTIRKKRFLAINAGPSGQAEGAWISVNKTTRQSGNNFLLVLICLLAKVAMQDGIYWIKCFPVHQVSLLLKQKIPGYKAWSSTTLYEGNQTRALNDVLAHAAFASVAVKLDVIGKHQD